jgi:hypothetical protein
MYYACDMYYECETRHKITGKLCEKTQHETETLILDIRSARKEKKLLGLRYNYEVAGEYGP